MKKRINRKLALSRQTLRHLSPGRLTRVAGGTDPVPATLNTCETETCEGPSLVTCWSNCSC